MEQTVKSDKAFTLIELLVSIVIILIAVMGLMQMSVVVMKNNLRNEIRNKAIEVLSNHIKSLTSESYNSIPPLLGTTYSKSYNEDVKIRNFVKKMTIYDNISKNSLDNEKMIKSTVSWQYGGKTFYYTINTVVIKNE